MSHTYFTAKHKKQKHQKTHLQSYLSNPDEPHNDEYYDDLPVELEANLLKNIEPKRQEFRRLAQRIRDRRSYNH